MYSSGVIFARSKKEASLQGRGRVISFQISSIARRVSAKVSCTRSAMDPIAILVTSCHRHFLGSKFFGGFTNFSRVPHSSKPTRVIRIRLWQSWLAWGVVAFRQKLADNCDKRAYVKSMGSPRFSVGVEEFSTNQARIFFPSLYRFFPLSNKYGFARHEYPPHIHN